jgi:membrane-anchored glycerophosphoryl diester phosphodiesterase (GDPDase)
MEFDMNRTWNQAVALVSANFQLLAVMAGIFLLLPSAAVYVAMPDLLTSLQGTEDPEVMISMLEEAMGPLIAYGLLAMLAQIIGYLGMIALMGEDRPTVGEALKRALTMTPSAIGATLLLALVYILVAVALSLALGLVIAGLASVAGEGLAAVTTFIGVIAMLVAVVYVVTRFTLTLPAIVLEGLANPVKAMTRSWQLTNRHAMKIFLFYALLFVSYLVISLILGSVFGLVAVAFGGGTGSALVLGLANGLIGATVAMVFSGILVSMHQQLSGVSPQRIEDTFG